MFEPHVSLHSDNVFNHVVFFHNFSSCFISRLVCFNKCCMLYKVKYTNVSLLVISQLFVVAFAHFHALEVCPPSSQPPHHLHPGSLMM